MTIATVMIVSGCIIAIFCSVSLFNEHCESKFSHAFIKLNVFPFYAAAFWASVLGYAWRHDALLKGGDSLNGLLLILLSVAVAIWFLVVNIRESDLVYGVLGTLLQIIVFSVLSIAYIPIVLIKIAIALILSSGDERKRTEYQFVYTQPWW